MIKQKSKFVLILTVITCLTLLFTGTVIVVNDKADLYIRITQVDWPTTYSMSGDTYVSFRFYSFIEIWNRLKENVTILTGHWYLITISMMASLDNESYEFVYSDLFFPIINTHTIEPGISYIEKSSIFVINNYNESIPPDGVYTVWAEFDGETDYTVNIYNTTIRVKNNETTISYQYTPSTWGTSRYWTPVAIILLSSGLSMVGVLVLLIVYRKKKKLNSRIVD